MSSGSPEDDDKARDDRQLQPVSTQSSGGSLDSAKSPSRFGSSLHQALAGSRSSSTHSHKHHKHHPHREDSNYVLPVIKSPVHLCELAITLMLSVPGVSVDVLRNDIVPKLYHVEAYQHRVNTREVGMDKLLVQMQRFRERFSSIKVKLRSNLMDMDGSSSMEAAAAALVYDIVAKEARRPGMSKQVAEEEKRCSSICVMKVYQGRIAQTDLVVDTKEFGADFGGPELSCVVM
ncbi:hypothetical protein JCM10449v2_003570 [Rhodotorula kratochvilovae]